MVSCSNNFLRLMFENVLNRPKDVVLAKTWLVFQVDCLQSVSWMSHRSLYYHLNWNTTQMTFQMQYIYYSFYFLQFTELSFTLCIFLDKKRRISKTITPNPTIKWFFFTLLTFQFFLTPEMILQLFLSFCDCCVCAQTLPSFTWKPEDHKSNWLHW